MACVEEISGAQRAILGAETTGQVREWIAGHVRDRLGVGVDSILFQGGDVGAVFCLRLIDGREIVVKALRRGADVRRLRAVVRAQNALTESGFGCARVLDGPSSTRGVLAVEVLQRPSHDRRHRGAGIRVGDGRLDELGGRI